MSKQKYYNHFPTRAKGHRITIATWKIEQNFYTEKDALKFRDEVKESIDDLKLALRFLKASNYKERLSPSDYEKLKEEVGEIHPLIDCQICDVPEGFETTTVNKTNPYVQDIVLAYLAHKEKIDDMPPSGEIGRYKYWLTSKIAKVRIKNVSPAMLELERDRIAKAKERAAGTVNRYMSCLSATWTHHIKTSTSGEFIQHVPQQVTPLNENTIHTEAYKKEDVHQIIDICYKADENRQYENQPSFQYLGPIVDLAAQTGIRSAFLSSMHVDEVFGLDTDDAFIRKPMKGGKLCIVPLTNRAKRVIIKQMELGTGWLFPKPNGKDHVTNWRNTFKRQLEKHEAKITKKPVHSFRAYAATNLRNLGLGVDDIAEMLQVTTQTVKGYITKTDIQRKRITKILNDAEDF